MNIVKLSTEDIQINKIYGLFVALTILGFVIYLLSYVQIFIIVFHLPEKEAQLKSLIHVLPILVSSYSFTSLLSLLSSLTGLVPTFHLLFIFSYQTFIFSLSFSQLYCPWSKDQTNLQPHSESIFLKKKLLVAPSTEILD